MEKRQQVEIKERDEWSGVAEFLGNIIAKYMELNKLQRKGVKWVDYPNIWC